MKKYYVLSRGTGKNETIESDMPIEEFCANHFGAQLKSMRMAGKILHVEVDNGNEWDVGYVVYEK